MANRDAGTITVLDAATLKTLHTWHLPGGGSPDMGGVSADGHTLWLSGRYDSVVYVLDTTTGKLLKKIPVDTAPTACASGPNPAATASATPATCADLRPLDHHKQGKNHGPQMRRRARSGRGHRRSTTKARPPARRPLAGGDHDGVVRRRLRLRRTGSSGAWWRPGRAVRCAFAIRRPAFATHAAIATQRRSGNLP